MNCLLGKKYYDYPKYNTSDTWPRDGRFGVRLIHFTFRCPVFKFMQIVKIQLTFIQILSLLNIPFFPRIT